MATVIRIFSVDAKCEYSACRFLHIKKGPGCGQNDDSTKEYGSVWKRLYATVPSLPEPPSFVCINRIIPQALSGSGLPPFHTVDSPCYMLCQLLKTSEKPPLRKTKEEMKEGALPLRLHSTLLSLDLPFFRPQFLILFCRMGRKLCMIAVLRPLA